MNDKGYASLIGRVLIGLIFVMSGINKIADPQGTQQYMAAMGISSAIVLLYAGAIMVELMGGLSLLLGAWARWGAIGLIGFMIPATLIFHTNFGDSNQVIHFMKNLAMIGGLLYVALYGPGRLSIDGRSASNSEELSREVHPLKRVVNQ